MQKVNLLAVALGVAIATSCGGGKKGYVVKGTASDSNLNGKMVYMTDMHFGELLDSALVTDGKFTFKGELDSAVARKLTLEYLDVKMILDEGTITVDMSDETTAKGSFLTEEYSTYVSKCNKIINNATEKFSAIDAALPDSVRVSMQEALMTEMYSSMDSISEALLKEHTDDVLGAMVFVDWMRSQDDFSPGLFKRAYDMVGESIRNFGPVIHMSAYYAKMAKVSVGEMFIDFTIENGNIDGSPASLSDYVGKGKYVLVDFWASWCGPCRKEVPNIASVYKKYKGDKFEVVSVAVWDKRDKTIEAIREDGNTWPQIVDAGSVPTDLYGIRGIPQIMLFGPDGTIVARDLRGRTLKAKVEEVMNK